MYLCSNMRGTVSAFLVFIALLLCGGSTVYGQSITKLLPYLSELILR